MKKFAILFLFTIGLLTTACPAPCDMTDEEIKAVYTELSPIVRAIENYKKDQKIYPRSLNELVPKYSEKTSPTVGGRKFEYIRISDEKYNLRVESRNGGSYSGSCSYSEIEERWQEIKDR